jgi:hypothetical protein
MIHAFGNRLNCPTCGLNRFVPGDESPLELTTFLSGWATWFDVYAAEHAHGAARPSLRQHVNVLRLMKWGHA